MQGHEKVIRYLVKHVNQFPSDSELTRYINTLSDADHAKKCEKCVEAIITAKEEQANKAIKNADKLLEEIDAEKVRLWLTMHLMHVFHCFTVFVARNMRRTEGLQQLERGPRRRDRKRKSSRQSSKSRREYSLLVFYVS